MFNHSFPSTLGYITVVSCPSPSSIMVGCADMNEPYIAEMNAKCGRNKHSGGNGFFDTSCFCDILYHTKNWSKVFKCKFIVV